MPDSISVFEVKVFHRDHPRHEFTQIFIGKPTPAEVISFVESMSRRDTYLYVIDIIREYGLPTHTRPAYCDPDTTVLFINPQQGGYEDGTIKMVESSFPVSSN